MKKILYILFILFISNNTLNAQVNNELKSFINKAFAYFPKVKEVENNIDIAKQKLTLVQLNNTAYVAANGSYNYVNPVPEFTFPVNGTDKEVKFQPNHNFNTGVNGSYTLYDFGRLKANVERAKEDITYSQHNTEATKFQLANQVSNIYYNIIYFKKAIAIQDSVLNFLLENKKNVEAKYKNGDGLKIDILNIQASIDNEENRKIDLQNSLQKQLNLLSYATGISTANNLAFDFNISSISTDEALQNALKNNVDFVLAKDRSKQTLLDIETIKLQDKPTINTNAALGFKNGIAPDIAAFRFNYSAGVGINIPIYTGGKVKQNVKLQQSILKQNELATETLQATVKKDIEQVLTDISTNIQRIKNTQGQIEQTKYAQQLASNRFVNGVGTNLELLNASTNVQKALFTRLQYEYQLCLAKVELAKLMGEKYW